MREPLYVLLLLLAAGCASTESVIQKQRIKELGDNLSMAVEADEEIHTITVTPSKGDNPMLSKWFARELESELVSRAAFIVLERENLDEILAEHQLVLSDIFDEEKRPEIGRLIGADALVVAEIQPSTDKTLYVLRGRLVALETGRILASEGTSLAAEDLDFSRKREEPDEQIGFFGWVGNGIIFLGKLPVTPIVMFLDIFETACIEERGIDSRVSHTYSERVLVGLWEGVPIPVPWIGGIFNNDLYMTRSMWNAWF